MSLLLIHPFWRFFFFILRTRISVAFLRPLNSLLLLGLPPALLISKCWHVSQASFLARWLLHLSCLVSLGRSPSSTLHLYSDGSQALIFRPTPPNLNRIPHLFFFLHFPHLSNWVHHYLVSQPSSDREFRERVLKYLFDFLSPSCPTSNSAVDPVLLEDYPCLQSFTFPPSLVLLLATSQIHQIWCCLRAFALTQHFSWNVLPLNGHVIFQRFCLNVTS